MDRSIKWRTGILVAIVAYCVAMVLPSFATMPAWYQNIFSKKITLGLDLRGGVHLVYSIALDKAVDDRASDIRRDMDVKLNDEKIKATIKTPSSVRGGLVFVLEDPSKKARVEQILKADYGDTLTTRACDDGPNAVCYRVSSTYADNIKKSALTNAVTTVRERIDEDGIAEASVVEKGDDVIVEIPGLDSSKIVETKRIIAQSAKLEMKMVVDADAYINSLVVAAFKDDAAKAQGIVAEGVGQPYAFLTAPIEKETEIPAADVKRAGCSATVNAAGMATCKVSGRYLIEKFVEAEAAKGTAKLPDDRELGFELDDKAKRWRTYYLDRTVHLTGAAISDAAASFDENGKRTVSINFTSFGGRIFGDLTAANVGKSFATLLDGKVKSVASIQTAIRGGRAQITLNQRSPMEADAEAVALVNVLKTGSLPASLQEESSSEVGPTLGLDSIAKTKLAFSLGILLVIAIMIGIYKWSGTIAIVSVALNVLMMMAAMVLFGATLTLPGIAALVLTVGMAVDANILIYERIRDELTLGKSVRGAVDIGFSRAFTAILDGQLTTAAAGFVLVQYGSGPIKGFAVMLLVGIATTLFTAVWASRVFFDLYLAKQSTQATTISI